MAAGRAADAADQSLELTPPANKLDSLLRFFTSELFDATFAIMYAQK